jgi:hypothetical protein
METIVDIHEEIENCESRANKAIMNNLGNDAIAFELRALRMTLAMVNLTLEEIRDSVGEVEYIPNAIKLAVEELK